MYYQDKFTWRNRLGEHVIAHHDGAVSAMIAWDGYDFDMCADDQQQQYCKQLYDFYHACSGKYYYEMHGWRRRDSDLIDRYVESSASLPRKSDFINYMRTEIAEHYRRFSFANDTAVVVTFKPTTIPLIMTASLVNQVRDADRMLRHIAELSDYLPGARLLTNQEYEQRILRTSMPSVARIGRFVADPYMHLNYQYCQKPDFTDNCLYHDGLWHQVLFLPFLPDAIPGHALHYAMHNVAMHVCQVFRPMSRQASIKKSERAAKYSGAHGAKSNVEEASRKLSEEAEYRRMLFDNNLTSFRNVFVVHLMDEDMAMVTSVARELRDYTFANDGGVADSSKSAQFVYYRVSQPGQGYMSPFWRADNTWQVANMAPVQCFRRGSEELQQLRLGLYRQTVCFAYSNNEVNHGLHCSKTGSGKDVENQHTLIETYAAGTNHLGIEIGPSNEWTVQGLGGTTAYINVDPDTTFISPFIPYDETDQESDTPLNSIILAGMTRGLAYVMLEDDNVGKLNYTMPVVYQAALDLSLQMLYAVPRSDRTSPIFSDLLELMRNPLYLKDKPDQFKASVSMSKKLDAFLSLSEGALFNRVSNVVLRDDLCFINLEPVIMNTRLFKYYLLFFGMRLLIKLYGSEGTTRFTLNEVKKCLEISPEIIGTLMDSVSRMGRKKGKSLHPLTQEHEELDAAGSSIINSLSHLMLLYRQSGHADFASRIQLPDHVSGVWSAFGNPKGWNFRNGIRGMYGEYYNLFLSYPQVYLDLSSSDPDVLPLKRRIGAITDDVFERLGLLREVRNGSMSINDLEKRFGKLTKEKENASVYPN